MDPQSQLDWPQPPSGRQVVLHTRVVTETGGGPDKTILLSPSYMADTPYWLLAAYMHAPDDAGFGSVRQRAVALGCPLVEVPDRGPLDRGVLRHMLDVCRHYGVRIWHGHDYKSNMLGLAMRPFWNMKLVSTVHGWVKHTARTPLYYAVDRWCLPYYHHVICVSADLQQRLRSMGVPQERLSLIHNAVDDRAYRRRAPAKVAPLRQKLHVAPEQRVVGAIGRLSPEKGFAHLIRAVHLLRERDMDVQLWIAGDGDGRADLEKLVEHLGMQPYVRLLGFVSNTYELYEAMDLFVLSSLREGLPNVVLEAMAMQVPVVATRVAGLAELIEHGRTGMLCQAGQTEQIAAACQQLLTDGPLRQRLAAAARKVIETRYGFGHRMQRVREIYDGVLGAQAAV